MYKLAFFFLWLVSEEHTLTRTTKTHVSIPGVHTREDKSTRYTSVPAQMECAAHHVPVQTKCEHRLLNLQNKHNQIER